MIIFAWNYSTYCNMYRISGNFRVKKLSYDKFHVKKNFRRKEQLKVDLLLDTHCMVHQDDGGHII